MGTRGWAIGLILLLVWAVLANYLYETALDVTCRHCGAQGVPGEDHSCPCPFSDEECPGHAE